MKQYRLYVGASLLLVLFCSTDVMAVISDINGLRIQLRRFNDFPNSTLSVTPAPPPPGPGSPVTYGVSGLPDVLINEGPFGAGGFANQHAIRFSSDAGASNYLLAGPTGGMSNDAFDIKVNIQLSVGTATNPQNESKEAGFRFDSFVAGECFFILKSSGEVAAFGGQFPFHSFGAAGSGAYVPGNQAQLRMIYRPDNDPNPVPGDASTLEYLYDNNILDATPPVSSGPLEMLNLENGLIGGTEIGMYVQNPPNDANPNDFSNAAFRNITVAVPEPVGLGLISLFGVAVLARRRSARTVR